MLTRLLVPRNLFNPLTVFTGIWLLTFALYELDRVLGFFNIGLTEYAGFMFVFSFVSFFIACSQGMVTARRLISDKAVAIRDKELDKLTNMNWLLLPIFASGVLWKYGIAGLSYGAFSENLSLIRQDALTGEFSFPLLCRLMTLSGYLIVLNLGVLYTLRPRPQYIVMMIVSILLSFVNDATTAGRGATFNSILLLASTGAMASSVRRGRLEIRPIVGATGVLIVGLLLTSTILYLRSDRSVSFFDRLVFDNYVYLTGAVPATSIFIEQPWPKEVPLQWTLAGLYQLVDTVMAPVFGWTFVSDSESFQTYYASITNIGPFNSACHIAYFYSDLGELGVIFLSACLGFFSGYAFQKALRQQRIVDIQLSALLIFAVFFTVRGILTNGMVFWVCLAMLVIQHRFVQSLATLRRPEMNSIGSPRVSHPQNSG